MGRSPLPQIRNSIDSLTVDLPVKHGVFPLIHQLIQELKFARVLVAALDAWEKAFEHVTCMVIHPGWSYGGFLKWGYPKSSIFKP